MQHDRAEKVDFWPIYPTPRVRGIYGLTFATMLQACAIFSNLIGNMSIFHKNDFLPLSNPLSSSGGGGGVGGGVKGEGAGFKNQIPFDMFHTLVSLFAFEFQ